MPGRKNASPGSPRPIGFTWQLLGGAVGLVFGLVAFFLSWHFPLALYLAVAFFFVYLAALLRWPMLWLLLLPAVLPVLDLAPWTGWLLFDEFDILILGTVAVALVRGRYARNDEATMWPVYWIIGLWLLAICAATVHGLLPIRSPDVSAWFATYTSPYNAIRIAKSALWAVLLLPCWWYLRARFGIQASYWLQSGITIGVLLWGLSILWERGVIYHLSQFNKWGVINSLLDFTTTHRVVGLMSQMHTGGSGIDSYAVIAVSLAFAFLLKRDIGPGRGIFVLAVSLLGAYATAVTFTRATYVAFAISVLVILVIGLRSRAGFAVGRACSQGWLVPLFLIYTASAFVVFSHGGVLTMAVLAAGCAASLGFAFLGERTDKSLLLVSLVSTALIVALGMGYAISGSRWTETTQSTTWLLSAVAAVAAVGTGYGSWRATAASPLNARLLMVAILCVALPMATIATGGYRMQERISRASDDAATRVNHWQDGLALVGSETSDWLLGLGLGRFPTAYILASEDEVRVGTYLYASDPGGGRLILGGGRDLRLGQRLGSITAPDKTLTLRGRAKWSGEQSKLAVSVCRRQLLEQQAYNGTCSGLGINFDAPEGEWTDFAHTFSIERLGQDRWSLPRFTTLRLGAGRIGGLLEIDDLALLDASGRDYLRNGDFEAGGEGWFSYNDFQHLAWHPKNLYIGVLVEQGIIGLAAFLVFYGMVMKRAWHLARDGDTLALGVLAATVGILFLGIFSTVLNVPRVAFLLYFTMLVIATTARTSNRPHPTAQADARTPGVNHRALTPEEVRSTAGRWSDNAWHW